jgi:hypothetical protein
VGNRRSRFDTDIMTGMAAAGLRNKEIAEQLGCSHQLVWQRLKSSGFSNPRAIPVPVGTRFGRLITVSEVYSRRKGTRSYRCVIASCECESSHAREYALVNLRSGVTRSCGCLRGEELHGRNYRGVEYPRRAATFLSLLTSDVCAWVLCGKPFQPGERIAVDHDHSCLRHDNRGDRQSCIYCVRGAVHTVCNTRDIMRWDWALDKGLGPIPENVIEYLSKTRPLAVLH